MPKYIKKKDLKNAIDECTWYHIGKDGELVEGANSSEHEPLYKYSDIKEIIKNLPTRKFENEPKRTALSKALKWTYGDEPNSSEKPNNCEPKICDTCRYYNSNIPCGSTPSACKEADKFAEEFVDGLKKLKQTEPTISKMEQVDKDINVRSKDEPTTQTKTQKSNLSFEKAYEPQTEDFKACVEGLTLLWIYNYVTDDEFHRIDARLKCKGEPQTENLFTDKYGDVWEWRGDAWYCISGDEPQTEEGASCRQARAKKFGEMDDATFKAHCMNCQRDPADIKCLDCDGNKYFLSYGAQTDCAWK